MRRKINVNFSVMDLSEVIQINRILPKAISIKPKLLLKSVTSID